MKHLLFACALSFAVGCYADDPPPQYGGAPPPGYAGGPPPQQYGGPPPGDPNYQGAPPPQGEDEDGGADLVEVSPGVEVIADYDEPVFFADDYYWVMRGGIWYSSTWYGGGWGRAGWVPDHIRGISHPEGYAHYRPAGWVAHEHVRGGYASHAQYHAAHPVGGGYRVRAAPHGGGGHRR